MSNKTKQLIKAASDLEENLRSRLPAEYVDILAPALTSWALVSADLFQVGSFGRESEWLVQLLSYSLVDVIAALKNAAMALRHWDFDDPACSSITSVRAFKRLFQGQERVILGYALQPCASYLHSFLQGNHFLLRELLTFLDWWRSITIDNPALVEAAEDSFLQRESEMELTEPSQTVVDGLREIFKEISFDITASACHHTNGATAELKRNSGLYRKMEYSSVDLGVYRFCVRNDITPLPKVSSKQLSSKYTTVPKSFDKRRGIAKEPTSSVYYTTALADSLSSFISSLSPPILLEDQSRNRDFAKRASRDRSYSTIDLTDASDCVSNKLVRAVFRDTAIFFDLQYLRTRFITVRGQRHRLQKFATMGSTLCFPVESLIFWGIVKLAGKNCGISRDFAIYGDDIICHKDVEWEVRDLLKQAGFSLNASKSFWSYAPFKESCGGEYFDGSDVTPMRLSRKFPGNPISLWRKHPELIEAYLSTINECYSRGYFSVRKYLLSRLLRVFPKIPFTHNPEIFGVLTNVDNVNYHLSKVVDASEALQTDVVIGDMPSTTTAETDSPYAIDAWLYSADRRTLAMTFRHSLNIVEERLTVTSQSRRLVRRPQPAWIYKNPFTPLDES